MIEGVIYLPENLFYSTCAPGIIIYLNKQKQEERKTRFTCFMQEKNLKKDTRKTTSHPEALNVLPKPLNSLKMQKNLPGWRIKMRL